LPTGSAPAPQHDQPAAEPDEDEIEQSRDTDDYPALRLILVIATAHGAHRLLAAHRGTGCRQ